MKISRINHCNLCASSGKVCGAKCIHVPKILEMVARVSTGQLPTFETVANDNYCHVSLLLLSFFGFFEFFLLFILFVFILF